MNRITTTPDMTVHTAPDNQPYEYAVCEPVAGSDTDWYVAGWFLTEEAAEADIESNGSGSLFAVEDPDDEEGGIK